jgi:hypothetical protein
VWSCVNGHANSPGAEFCATCGARVEAGLAAAQQYGVPSEYASDYTTGSFAEYIDAMEPESGIPVFPSRPFPAGRAGEDAAVTPVAGFTAMLSAPWAAAPQAPPPPSPPRPSWADAGGQDGPPGGYGWQDDGPATKPGPVLSADTLAQLQYRKPSRTRMLVVLAAVAILGITGVTGTLIVMHSRRGAAPAGVAATNGAATASSGGHGTGKARPGRSGATTEGVARWAAPAAIDPQTLQGATTITGLSCPHAGVCYAADSAGTVLALQSAGNWPVAATDPAGGLVAISCPAKVSCVAIDSQGEAIVLSQGSWGSPAPIGSGSGTVTSVSCASADFCIAVDSIGQAFTYAGPSAGWSQETVVPSGQGLAAVSCPSTTDCVAVGAGGDVYTYNGSAWSGPEAVDNGHNLVAVSCPSTGFCMAVDSAGLAAQFAAGQWTLHPLGFAAATVSCPAVGSCLAGGSSGMVASYAGDGWSAAATVDNGATINQLSCVALNSCVATDQIDNVLFYSAR